MINIKYLKDKITFTCIYCHYYVVPENFAYMIMHKKGGGLLLKMSWLAYNIYIIYIYIYILYIHIYVYIYIYVMLKR